VHLKFVKYNSLTEYLNSVAFIPVSEYNIVSILYSVGWDWSHYRLRCFYNDVWYKNAGYKECVMKKMMLGMMLVLVCTEATVLAQGLSFVISDTLWVKVTLYDFRTNTNFGGKNCGTASGQVQDTLDSDRKPIFLKDRCSNDLVNQWYRPSGASGAAFQPFSGRWSNLTSYKGRENEWVGKAFAATDPMANIVFYDSLPFTLVDSTTGTYNFSRTNQHPSGGFFWLDGKGFGEEPAGSGHNYYFTMELHKEFIYQGGEVFSFRGDDDVWVFINGKLALDLGGMQAETKRTLSLDAIAAEFGLEKGMRYPMDFFYSERHEPQSNCEITTNLLTPVRPSSMVVTTSATPPASVLTPSVSDTVLAIGATIPLYVYLFNDNGELRTDIAGKVTWQFVGPASTALRKDTVATHVSFTLPPVTGCVTLYQKFDDPLDSLPAIVNSIRICPKAGSVPPDTSTPRDTTTIPRDTSSVPPDTTVNPNDTTVIPVDSIGAIIRRVVYYPGIGNAEYDTLRITLTEPVECIKLHGATPENVFNVKDGGTFSAGALSGASFIGGCDSMMVTMVTIVVPVNNSVITPEKDSMVLKGEVPYVVDGKGDLPPDVMKQVVIEWGTTGIVLGVLQNPSSATTPIDAQTIGMFALNFSEGPGSKGATEKVGTIVAIQTVVPFVRMDNAPDRAGSGDIFGIANIYDAVGNLVAVDLPLKRSTVRDTYGVHWNMRNRNNRAVAKGVYLIAITLTPENHSKPIKRTIKIAVK